MLSQSERENVLFVLKDVEKLIRSGQYVYICNAIQSCERPRRYSEAEDYLCTWVRNMLGKHPALEYWILENCKEYREEISSRRQRFFRGERLSRGEQEKRWAKMRRTRLAWLAWMRSEIEKETNP